MDVSQAYDVCRSRFASGTEEFWTCVQQNVCGPFPSSGCRLLIATLRWINPIPKILRPGDSFSRRGIKEPLLSKLGQLHEKLSQANADVNSSDILEIVNDFQAAGMHRRALQGVELINQIEMLADNPQIGLIGRALEIKATSLEAIGNNRAATESRALATILARVAG